MSEDVRRDALAWNIAARLLSCNADELRVLDVLLGRLELGRDRYGFLDLARARDWEKEEAEEHADAAVYRACGVLADRDAKVDEARAVDTRLKDALTGGER
jgi:hypothetical protein